PFHKAVDPPAVLLAQPGIHGYKSRVNPLGLKFVDFRLVGTPHFLIVLIRLSFPVPPVQIACMVKRMPFPVFYKKCNALIIGPESPYPAACNHFLLTRTDTEYIIPFHNRNIG